MRPEHWYQAFWVLMGVGFMVVNFFVIRLAVRDGIVHAARVLGWTKD